MFPNRKHGTLVAEGHSRAARIRLDYLEGDRGLDITEIGIIARPCVCDPGESW
jgi:hypothetical protein